MAARKLSRTDRYYLELFTCYGLHSVNLAQGIYDLFLESQRDSSEQGLVEQRKLLSRLTEVLSRHGDLMIEGLEECKKASDQKERVTYDSTDPADVIDAHYFSGLMMYGRLCIDGALTGCSILENLREDLTGEEFVEIIEVIGYRLMQFHDLVEESIRERQKHKASQSGAEGKDTQDM